MPIVTVVMSYEPLELRKRRSTNTMKTPTDELHTTAKERGKRFELKMVIHCISYRGNINLEYKTWGDAMVGAYDLADSGGKNARSVLQQQSSRE